MLISSVGTSLWTRISAKSNLAISSVVLTSHESSAAGVDIDLKRRGETLTLAEFAALANMLLEKEVIFTEDLEAIFGKRGFDDKGNFIGDPEKDKEESAKKAEQEKKDKIDGEKIETDAKEAKSKTESTTIEDKEITL